MARAAAVQPEAEVLEAVVLPELPEREEGVQAQVGEPQEVTEPEVLEAVVEQEAGSYPERSAASLQTGAYRTTWVLLPFTLPLKSDL